MMSKKIGNRVYFVAKEKRRILAIGYDFNNEKYVAEDTNIFSEHITGESVVDMAYQQSPYNMLWCCSEDGHVGVMMKQDEEKTLGWSRVTTDGNFESVAVIPGEPIKGFEWDFAFVQIQQ